MKTFRIYGIVWYSKIHDLTYKSRLALAKLQIWIQAEYNLRVISVLYRPYCVKASIIRATFIADIKYLFLVGGFSESPILQHEIRREFSHILKILIPQDVALTILKGLLIKWTTIELRLPKTTFIKSLTVCEFKSWWIPFHIKLRIKHYAYLFSANAVEFIMETGLKLPHVSLSNIRW